MTREDIMNSYAENLRRSIVNTTRRFKEMTDELKAKQDAADREELDTMWQQALIESVKDGEQFTRYHFANLVAAAEREACAKVCEIEAQEYGTDTNEWYVARACAVLIHSRGK